MTSSLNWQDACFSKDDFCHMTTRILNTRQIKCLPDYRWNLYSSYSLWLLWWLFVYILFNFSLPLVPRVYGRSLMKWLAHYSWSGWSIMAALAHCWTTFPVQSSSGDSATQHPDDNNIYIKALKNRQTILSKRCRGGGGKEGEQGAGGGAQLTIWQA